MTTLLLPGADGPVRHTLGEPGVWRRPDGPLRSRIAFAAAHVVADPLGDNSPGAPAAIDWEATLAFRRHLWSWGFGVAEAMDTAQRGMGLDWSAARELIARTAADGGGPVAAGAGTDQAPDAADLDAVLAAYHEQVDAVQDAGARVIVMASRRLAAIARTPADYRYVYDRLLPRAGHPVILHWLGEAFDPALGGYWGSRDIGDATAAFLDLVHDHAGRVDGVKVSLLDADHEKRLRADLPAGVRLYTGDDFHYPELIKGDGGHHSDALLGVFAAIAPAASTALQALDAGDEAGYEAAFAPTLALARHLFAAPTYHYKTGICFLAWLAGHHDAFAMVGGMQSARSLPHLVEAFRLADAAGLLPDPDLAAARMTALLAVHGFDA